MRDVLACFEPRLSPRTDDLAALAAPATPREADPPEPVAAKISVRLLQAHGAEPDSVKGHGA
jgi:hypothetical protein